MGRRSDTCGEEKTLDLVTWEYTWPEIYTLMNQYIPICYTYIETKTPRHRCHGQLQPLPIPPGSWESVSMDFIVELPQSQGYDAISVCVDQFTKMAHFIPTNSNVIVEQTADLYFRNIFKTHRFFNNVVLDRGT